MFPPRLLKSINWTLAVAMLLQPILGAIPPEVVRAAPVETAPQTIPEVAAIEPLTATVPAPLLAADDAAAPTPAATPVSEPALQPVSQPGLQANPDWPPPDPDFTVDSINDAIDDNLGDGICASPAGECTLRAAIMQANELDGEQVIKLPARHYDLSIAGVNEDLGATGDLDITDSLTLVGEGATTTIIDANYIDRALNIREDQVPAVTISGVTIQHGDSGIEIRSGDVTLTNVSISNNGDTGGVFHNSGDLTIVNSTVNQNGGGGVVSSCAGGITIDRSLIADNQQAGISIDGHGSIYIDVTNSTVSGNVGGIHVYCWASAASYTHVAQSTEHPALQISNTTVVNNTDALHGGLYVNYEWSNPGASLTNVVLANNGPTNCHHHDDYDSPIVSLGHNLSDDATCNLTDPTDLPNTDPRLGPLQDNGGPTFTHALLPGSPVINAGDNAACPLTDQRGVKRPQGAGCDIGAYEFGGAFAFADHYAGGGSDWPVDNYARQTQAYVGNPINTANGNQTYETTDLRLPTASGDIYFSRSYSSFNAYYDAQDTSLFGLQHEAGSLGPGWMHNYETHLKFPLGSASNLIGLLTPGANYAIFEQDEREPNRYTKEGFGGEIVRTSTHFTYTSPEGIEMFFYDDDADVGDNDDLDGYLAGRLDYIDFQLNGDVDLVYTEYAPGTYMLDTVSDATGTRSMTFTYHTYEESGQSALRLQTVSLSDGRSISFEHTLFPQDVGPIEPEYWNTNLIAFTDMRGQEWRYQYADSSSQPDLFFEANPYLRHFLTARQMPVVSGHTTIISYDYQDSPVPDAGFPAAWAIGEVDGSGQQAVSIVYGAEGEPTTAHFGAGSVGPNVEYTYDGSLHLIKEQIVNQTGESIQGKGWRTFYLTGGYRPLAVFDPNGLQQAFYSWTDNHMSLETVTDAASSQFYQFVSQELGLHLPELIFYPYPDGGTPTRIKTRLIYNTLQVADPNQDFSKGMSAEDEDERRPNPYATYSGLPQQLLLAREDDFDPATGLAGFTTRYYYYFTGVQAGRVRCIDVPTPGGDTFYSYVDAEGNSIGQPVDIYQGCDCGPYGEPSGGLHTHISYDEKSRVHMTTSPEGLYTYYEYVGQSDLVSVVTRHYNSTRGALSEEADGDTWNIKTAYFYNAAGRLMGTIENYDPDYENGMDASYDFNGDGAVEIFRVDSGKPHMNRAMVYHYDTAGRVNQVTANFHPGMDAYEDGYNFTTRTVYDGAGRAAAVIENYTPDSVGGVIPQPVDLDGDGQGDLSLALSPDVPDLNRITINRYDALDRLEQVISPAWPPTPGVTLDDYVRVGSVTYNRITAYEYDPVGNVVKTIVNYDPESGISVTDRNIATCTEYDVLNRPVFTRTACVEGVGDYHTENGNVYNLVTYTAYDALSRPIVQVENYDGLTTRPMPEEIELTPSPERNHITRIYYDGLGRAEWGVQNMTGSTGQAIGEVLNRAAASAPDYNLVARSYYDDATGQQIAVVDNYREKFDDVGAVDLDLKPEEITAGLEVGYNHVTRTFFRADGLVDAVTVNFTGYIRTASAPPAFVPTSPDRNLTTYYGNYDPLNRPLEVTISRGGEAIIGTQSYDNLGRVRESTAEVGEPEPRTTLAAYANLGFSVTTTEPAGRVVRTSADVRGNPSTTVAPSGAGYSGLDLKVTNDYDLFGRVTRSYDGVNMAAETTYDPLGQALRVVSGARVTTYTYTLLGQVEVVKEEGVNNACSATHYAYDQFGRLLRVHENYTNTDGCDANGVEFPKDVETEYFYDEMGNLIRVRLASGSTRQYEYDALGRATFEVLDPTGQKLFKQYCYDAGGNVTRTIGGSGQVSADVDWCAAGPPAEHLLTQYTYDALGHPTHIDYEEAGGGLEAAADVRFEYDAFGSRKTMLETGGRTWHYTSTRDGLLKTVDWEQGDTQGAQVAYGYDPAGDRTRLTVGSLMDVGYKLDAAGRLEYVDTNRDGTGDVVYAYNKASQVDTVSLPNGITSIYDYDPLGWLKEITHKVGDNQLSSFTYTLDGLGNRTEVAEVLQNPSSQTGAARVTFGWGSTEDEHSSLDSRSVPLSDDEDTLTEPATPEPPDPTPSLPSATPEPGTAIPEPETATPEPTEDIGADAARAVQSPNQPIIQSANHPINQSSAPPAAPSSVMVAADSPTQLTIIWQDNSEDETGFVLEWSADSGVTWTQLADQPGASYTHTPLLCQTAHSYRVRAYNAAGSSGWATGGGLVGSCRPGMLDATFGSDGIADGIVITDMGDLSAWPTASAVQSSGRIVAVGTDIYSNLVVVRYNLDGSLDISFSGDGIAVIPTGSSYSGEIYAVALQADRKIVVAGYTNVGAGNDLWVARLSAKGILDTAFGAGGVVTTDLGGDDEAYSVAVQPDGKIVAAGHHQADGSVDAVIVRYNADGSLDTTFGANGIVSTDVGSSHNDISSVALQPDGKIVAAGEVWSEDWSTGTFTLYRYNPDGSLDATFGSGAEAIAGIVTTDIGPYADYANAIILLPDGKIMAAGSSGQTADGSQSAFALARYNADGALDTTFGVGGMVVTNLGSGLYSAIMSVVLQSDGKIIAVGSSAYGGYSEDFALARYSPDGTLDTSFGGDGEAIAGIVITDISPGYDSAVGAAIQLDDRLVVVGSADYEFALARYYTEWQPPAVPTDLTATPTGQAQIDLAWADVSDSETAFLVERSPDGTSGWAEIGSVEANGTAYQDNSLACGTTAYYRVRAYRADDETYSDYSSVVSASTAACQGELSITGGPLDFGSQDVGATSVPQTLVLANTGTAYIDIDNISLTGDFALAESSSCPPGASTLDVGASCTADVVFAPTAEGARIGQLTVAGSAPGVHTVDLSGTGVTPGAPGVPLLASPAAGLLTNDNTPEFTWEAAANGYRYHIQIDNNSTFASPEVDATIAGLVFTPATALADGAYSWRVRTINSLGVTSDWSTPVRTLTVDATLPAAPTLKTPADGARLTTLLPRLDLTAAVTGANRYHYQVADNPDFAGPTEATVTTIYYTLIADQSLAYGGTYYWRARALDAAGNPSEWSTVRRFEINLMTAPADGSWGTVLKPAFSWTTLTGATYKVQVDDSTDFSDPLLVDAPASTASYTPTTDLPYGTLYWRLQVLVGSAPSGGWMGPWSFIVTPPPLAAPTPAGPASGFQTNDNTPEFTWNAVADAAGYQIQADNNGSTFPSPEVDATTGSLSFSPDTSLADGTYTWRMRAQNIYGVWGSWSSGTLRTVIVDTVPPAAPALSAPADDIHVPGTPTYSWAASSTATAYRFEYDDSANFSSPIHTSEEMTVRSYAPPTQTPGTYYWHVQARDAAGNWSAWSTARRVAIVPNNAAPTLTSPAAGFLTNDNTPELTWSPVAYGVSYQVQVDDSGSAFPSPEITAVTGDLAYVPTTPLADGDNVPIVYTWRVRARDVYGVWSAWSATRTFTVDTTPPAAPVLTTPADATSTTDTTPALTLTAATGANRYTFQVADNPDFSEPLVEATGTAVTYTLSAAQALSFGQIYYWRGRALDTADNVSEWSEVRDFTVTVHSAPVDGASSTDTTPTFTWVAVTGATGYRLQLDDNSDFSSPAEVEQTARTYTPPALAYGRYYWRVRAMVDAVWGPWMPAWTTIVTTTALAAPVLTSPASGATMPDNTPELGWNEVTNAVGYQVQMDNTSSAFPSPEIDATTEQSPYSPIISLPDGTIYWRVRAVNAYGVGGTWSAVRSVKVDTTPPAAPVLTTPADATSTTDTTPALTLTAATGANRYTFQVADNPDFSEPLVEATGTVVTYTLSAAQALSFGQIYYWRARALDTADNVSEWSEVRDFTVTVHKTPVDGSAATDTTPTFTWVAATGATGYQLQVADNAEFTGPVIDRNQTAVTYTPTTALSYGRYYWRVRVVTAAGEGPWMPAWSTIVTTAALAAPTLASPASGATVSDNTPELGWNEVTGAAQYQVQVDNLSSFAGPEADGTTGGLTYSPTTPLADGTYYWHARTQNIYGAWGAWGSARTVKIDTTPPAAPALSAPANYAAVVGTPTYTWAAASTAAAYQFEYDTNADFSTPDHYLVEVTTTSHKPPTQPPGEYFWRVRARDASGNWSEWSLTRAVSIAPPVPAAPTLLTPAANAATPDNLPDFTWSPVDYGVNYQIQIDDLSTFAGPEQNIILPPGVTAYAAEHLFNGTFYWRVRAINALGQRGAWSAARKLIVNATPPDVPELISPADMAQENDPAPVFSWSEVEGAAGYQIQIAGAEGFSNPVQSLEVEGTSVIAQALPGGGDVPIVYTWRVRSLDEWGATQGWSETNNLSISTRQMTYDWHYEYDGLSRLIYACSSGWTAPRSCTGKTFDYTYDNVGNLLSFTRFDATPTVKEPKTVRFVIDDGANQVDCVDVDGSSACTTSDIDYVYDAFGNLISDGLTLYTYDTAMRLVMVQSGTSITQYEYSGDGDRVAQVDNGTRTEFTLDVASSLTQVLAETNTETGKTITYLYGLGLVGESSAGMTEYHLTDALGSVRQLTDIGGRVLLNQSFDPYGNPFQRSRGGVLWDARSPFGWAGEQSDPSGLIYLRARYYAPSMGRFTQLDPFAGALAIPASMNGYGYGHGSPMMYTDPSGEFVCGGLCAAAIIVGLVGLGVFAWDYGSQVEYNMQMGKGFGTAIDPANVNWQRSVVYGLIAAGVAAAAVVGCVAAPEACAILSLRGFALLEAYDAFDDALTYALAGNGDPEAMAQISAMSLISPLDGPNSLVALSDDVVEAFGSVGRHVDEIAEVPRVARGFIKLDPVPQNAIAKRIERRQSLAELLVAEAAKAAGVDLYRYVDEVLYDPHALEPTFEIPEGTTIRRIIIDPATLEETSSRQLVIAGHEMAHALHFDTLRHSRFEGNITLTALYFFGPSFSIKDPVGYMNYGLREIWTEMSGLFSIKGYLGSLPSETIEASIKYMDDWWKRMED